MDTYGTSGSGVAAAAAVANVTQPNAKRDVSVVRRKLSDAANSKANNNSKGKSTSAAGKPLIFDGSFESGNLGQVVKISDFEYDVYMANDSNNTRFRLWYTL